MTKYFINCKNLDELKKAYKKAAMEHHPDMGGDTRKHKESLKACGCRWSNNKKLWSWHFAEEGAHWHRGSKTMSQIRNKYGSTTFTKTKAEVLPA